MTVRQPLFQQNDTTDQSAEIFRLFFKHFMTERSGIITENAFQVTQHSTGADATVDIKSGSLLVAGSESSTQGLYHIINDRDIVVPRPAAPSATLSRLDTIVVRARDSVFPSGQLSPDVDDAVVEWVTGTPTSGTPIAPDLDALGYENYYKLANVKVPAGSPTTPVTSSNITDLRTTAGSTSTRATAIGCIIPCTSANRPSTPRHGLTIWEEDTKRIVLNEGTSSANWVTYGVSNLAKWQSFSSGFPISGSGTVTWGRYIRIGNSVFGTTGFRFSQNGTGNLSGPVYCRLPVRAATSVTGLVYIGGGRAFDSTGLLQGVFWSGTATVLQNDTYLRTFATQGLPLWDATHPFNWGSGTLFEKADSLEMFFMYEAAE